MVVQVVRPVEWVGSSKADLQGFPDAVRRTVGYALYQAQVGLKHRDAKPLRGLGNRVPEVVSRHDGDTFRAAYTVGSATPSTSFTPLQKKAKRGMATPRPEIDLIARRLKAAERHYRANYVE